jgi:2-amino-4-hydroxy-6-hydroxymethyldihydropteridine diphosphokinase
MTVALVGLGSNLGDRAATLAAAAADLARLPGELVAHSRLHETAAAGGPPGQPAFLNAAATLATTLSPHALREALSAIEVRHGRRWGPRWGPRTLDLDLLLLGDQVIETRDLTVPHPRMAWRRFVLEPAAEVAGELVHPRLGRTIAQLRDRLLVRPLYVAVTGPPEAAADLAADVAATSGGVLLDDPGGVRASSGRAAHSPLESLRARAARLRRDALPHDAELLVSGFWLGAPPPASLRLPPERLSELTRELLAASQTAIEPTLLILIEEHEPTSAQAPRPGLVDAASRSRLPVLRLPAGDAAAALAEAQAAIASMR